MEVIVLLAVKAYVGITPNFYVGVIIYPNPNLNDVLGKQT